MEVAGGRAWAEAMARIVAAANGPGGGVQLLSVSVAQGEALRRVVTGEVERLGFIPVTADRHAAPELPPRLLHRHIAVFCADEAGRQLAIGWVRTLAQTSPRRHVVVCFSEEEAGGALAVERDDVCGSSPSPPTAAAARQRLEKAARWLRRGRPHAAELWVASAAAAASRHGDASAAARLHLQLAQGFFDRGLPDAASRPTQLLLGTRGLDWATYANAAALWADIATSRGELVHAREWLFSVVAEAALRREAVPAGARTRVAELEFWLGAPKAVISVGASHPCSAEEVAWSALAAWSRGHLPKVSVLAAQLMVRGRAGNPRASFWGALLRVLLARDDRAAVEERTAELDALARSPQISEKQRALARAVCGRAWLIAGRRDRASVFLVVRSGRGPESRLIELLRARTLAAEGAQFTMRRAMRSALAGLESFLGERGNMHLVDGLTGLLQVMEDAEDELSALSGGCQWVRRQSGAAAVGIVSADATRLITAHGWKTTDLSAEIAQILAGPARDVRLPGADPNAGSFGVSIRYGGITLGHVVARGWPSERPALQQAVQALAAVSGSALHARLETLALKDQARDCAPEILGRSPLIAEVREAIARAAVTTFPVLIEGESGTGKELVARALHRLSPRRDHRFLAVNCAALTDDLVEAELFGHARGAFTGAVGPRAGLFEDAHGGTVFLDEVSDLSPRAQAKLLRVLQEREIRRVGENTPRRVDVRAIAATNLPLAEAVSGGRFRDDLRFRLAVVRIRVPPLRDRLEDLPLLAHVFWRRAVAETGKRAVLGPDALVRLARHTWPGNVRELQNVIAGLAVAAPARGRVTERHVVQVTSQVTATDESSVMSLDAARRMFERRVVGATLARHAGRRTAAANELGLTRQGLTKALRRLGLSAAAGDEEAAGVA